MTIKLEASPGESIENAFTQAIFISKLLHITAEFDFNGVTCFANGTGSVDKGVKSYFKQTEKPQDKFKIAIS